MMKAIKNFMIKSFDSAGQMKPTKCCGIETRSRQTDHREQCECSAAAPIRCDFLPT